MKKVLDAVYWNTRYLEGNTAWDLKQVSPPLKEYIDQLQDKNLKILIPGGGYGFEAQYLWEKGFKNTYVIDLSEIALTHLQKRIPSFPKEQLVQGDFFTLTEKFDLIVEQTFFCALNPELRPKYVEQMHHMLNDDGKLVGLLFNFPLTEKGPPYGGSIPEYKFHFKDFFKIEIMETAYNSIESRDGAELFIKLLKK